MQTILITGASSGFGEKTAIKFAEQGWQVIAAARRTDKLKKLSSQYKNIKPLPLDVRDAAATDSLISELESSNMLPDLLFNNAGLALGLESADSASLADWENMIATNITGLVRITRLLLPGMVKKGGGYIINMGSIAGRWPYYGGNVYGPSKAFVEQFSNNLRTELSDKNIRVTTIAPGLSGGTEFSTVRFQGDVDAANRVYEKTTPLKPEDVAETVWWLANMPAHIYPAPFNFDKN